MKFKRFSDYLKNTMMSLSAAATDLAQAEACMINQLIMSCVEEKFDSKKNKILKFNRLKIYLTHYIFFCHNDSCSNCVEYEQWLFLSTVKNYKGHNQNLIVDFKIKIVVDKKEIDSFTFLIRVLGRVAFRFKTRAIHVGDTWETKI